MCTNEVFGASEFPGEGNPHCPQCRGSGMLLPAIEPEGGPAGMHPKVRQALVSMADLWGAFAGDIQTGLIDPCGNGYFLLDDGARIVCGYESREAALAECRQIIESIDHLLEGRSHD